MTLDTRARPGLLAQATYGFARASGWLSRQTGRGRGGTIPGRLTLALRPEALTELSAARSVLLVSGTNGKSTTTRLLAASLAAQGPVVSNDDGANLLGGLVAALLPPRDLHATAVLEVDERLLPVAIAACSPNLVVLLNLSRDQLDRFEEVGSHVLHWSAALRRNDAVRIVANAADPLVVAAVRGARPDDHLVTWVDVGAPWRDDAPLCPVCGNAWEMHHVPWSCDECGATMPAPHWRLDGVDGLADAVGNRLPLGLSLVGRAAAANAVMAAAAADVMGVPVATAVARFAAVADVDGRYQTHHVGGRTVQLLLAKNPAGWLEVLDQITGRPGTLIFGINARAADGADPSWLWDVPFESLRDRHVIAFGDRALDLSVRLHYAGVPHEVAADVLCGLSMAADHDIVVAANYTAFVAARAALNAAAS